MTSQIGNLGFFEAARVGLLKGHDTHVVNGMSEALSTSMQGLVNIHRLTLTYPVAAVSMSVASTSANDAAGGTGAITMRVDGLDENFAEIYETITITGTTPVVLNGLYFRINRMSAMTAGASATNEGDIYIAASTDTFTDGVPTTPYNVMTAMAGHATSGIYTVPAETKAIAVSIAYTCGEVDEVTAGVERCAASESVWHRVLDIYASSGSSMGTAVMAAANLPAGTDVRIRARSSISYGTMRMNIGIVHKYYNQDRRTPTDVG